MEYKGRKSNPTKTIVFILIGGALVILADLFLFGGAKNIMNNKHNVISDASVEIAILKDQHNLYMSEGIYIDPSLKFKSKSSMPSQPLDNSYNKDNDFAVDITIDEILAEKKAMELATITPALGVEKDIKQGFSPLNSVNEQDQEFTDIISGYSVEEPIDNINIEDSNINTNKETYSYKEPVGGGKIAIIIDDMGISLRSKLVEILPAPLTLSYLPYAKNLEERTARASQNGHELMVHMPMEPMNKALDTGPKVLSSKLSDKEFTEVLDWGLSKFDGFVGINNHMGSKITQDKDAMRRLMDYLKEKDSGLFFIDSKTIGSSVAASVASENGVPYAVRDVFLDHEITANFINGALKKLEEIAHKKGYAIAIAHPHKETIEALKAWLPTLKDKGLTLVPVSKLVKR